MKEKNNTIVLAIGIVALLLVGFFAATLMVPKLPDEIKVTTGSPEELQRTLSANGTVEKLVSPDQAEIYLSVETLANTASVSQENNAKLAEQVRTALKNAGVKDSEIETTYYTVNEEFEWEENWTKKVSKGFRTTNSIKITIKNLTKTGSIVDAAVSAGANRVSNIQFTLSKEAQERAKQEALTDAAKMAKTKAQSIASGLGVTLGKVNSITENAYYYTPNYRNYDMAMNAITESKAETPITPGDVSVSATVSVIYEIE
ncbi:MAG: SIMPL domain-containing protein [Candidatus Diapherotrites archaeon]|jgi:uncharacterized protein YggE|uniref:SIMPL domain-containing protein n=1 Tax=Candidatus Iainarchaeum sp. TaxID=3101447 RepID=A0A7K4BZY8_9ARCH|nr:SIMPL domain-containing protein [Candidatus Diapherotrites archaeon]